MPIQKTIEEITGYVSQDFIEHIEVLKSVAKEAKIRERHKQLAEHERILVEQYSGLGVQDDYYLEYRDPIAIHERL